MEHFNLNPILAKHAREIIQYLINQNIHFSVQCNLSKVKFDPLLPEEISKNFHPIIDFILAGFTFESIEIWEYEMSFEAGFGKENFASLVMIPFSCIIQISVPTNNSIMRDICIFMNTMNVLDLGIFNNENTYSKNDKKQQKIENQENAEEDELLESSRKAILSNPNNKF